MTAFLQQLFRSDFMPHGHCYFWRPEILWLQVGSDALIALAYYCIPLALWYFVRHRKDLAFNWIFGCFAAFIFACGTSHAFQIWTVWHGTYRLEGAIKAATALLSIITAVLLVPLIPKAIALPTARELEEANRALAKQILEREEAEAEVRRLNAELEARVEARTADLQRSNEELAQFAYVASHDLQEPLRMVASYTQLLARRYRGKLDEDADQFIHFAVDGATRMQRLIEDLLSYSRLENASNFQETPADAALDGALANLAFSVQETGAIITHDPLPVVVADQGQLSQVFQNLIGNSIKYSGGRTPEVHVGARLENGAWTFSVRDRGIGLDPAYAERIFGVFKRLHGADYPGTGIGLSIARKIIQRHQGRIWCESAEGEGATFFFTIPAGKRSF